MRPWGRITLRFRNENMSIHMMCDCVLGCIFVILFVILLKASIRNLSIN